MGPIFGMLLQIPLQHGFDLGVSIGFPVTKFLEDLQVQSAVPPFTAVIPFPGGPLEALIPAFI